MRGFNGPPTNPPEPSAYQSHEHEWRPAPEEIILEDCRAIFTMECEWVEITGSSHSKKHDETFYSTGAECDETKTYSMEFQWVEQKDGNIRFEDGDEMTAQYEEAIIEVEMEGDVTDADPDPDVGHVVVESENWKARYEA